jgi:hypothetical protein
LFSSVYAPNTYKISDYINKKTLYVLNILKLVLLDRYLGNINKPVASKLVSESSYTRIYALGELIVPPIRLENIFERSTPVATVAKTRVSDLFTQIFFFELKLILSDRYLINIKKPIVYKLAHESSYSRIYAPSDLLLPPMQLENIYKRSAITAVPRGRVSDSFSQIVLV